MLQVEVHDDRNAWIYSSMREESDFAEILPFFVDELPEKQALLSDLARAEDVENLQHEAHKLRGSAGGYGFAELSELAARLEESCKSAPRDVAAILRNLDELLDHLGRVRI